MIVTQTLDKEAYETAVRRAQREAAFKDWQHRLNTGDTLPRGKYFKGKKAGKPRLVLDEAWLMFRNC